LKKSNSTALRQRLMLGSILVSAVALSASPGLAQTTTTTPAEPEAKGEVVVVTGSRIRSQDYSAISPVTTVGAEQVELSGTLTVDTLLNSLPQVIPGNTVTSNNAGGEDFATIDLRGLGPSRTLVIIDGERVPAASLTGVVDINTIPAGLIERIEVVTGGASSVYGSDAVAGVVNFILKDDFEGGQFNISTGSNFDGKGATFNADALVGGNFDNGKGNATLYASYGTRQGVRQSEFDWSRVSGALVYGYDLNTGSYTGLALVDSLQGYLDARTRLSNNNAPGFISGTFAGGGSGTPPWASISNNAGNPFRNLSTNPLTAAQFSNANTDCNPATPGVAVNGGNLSFNDNNQLTPFFGGQGCAVPIRANGSSRYNFAPDNFIFLPFQRYGIQSFVNYQLTEKVKMKAMLSYVRTVAEVQLAPTPITGISVPVSSPAVQSNPQLLAALNSRPNPLANFTTAWRSSAVGPRAGEFVNSSLTTRVSFVGELPDNWRWNLLLGWGQVNFNSRLANNANLVALNQGLAGCANIPAPSRLAGCVDVDIFGPNRLTTAMANFIRTDIQTTATIEQNSVSGFVTGDLFKLPAGPVSVVLGFDYRDDDGSFIVDDAQRRGEIAGFNAQQSIFGAIEIKEVYGEVAIPILKDKPFVDSLNIEAGFRRSDYSTVGAVNSFKYGLSYAPTDWLRLRTVFNKAIRAPNAQESFQAGDQGFAAFADPCRATVTNANADIRNFCTTNGNIGRGFVPLANQPTFAATNSQVQAFAFGNPDLEAEEADTFTVGLVFEPDFVKVGNFRATVDYYKIDLDKGVIGRGAQTIINSCYGGLGTTPQSAVDCQNIFRDPATGQIDAVNTGLTNALAPISISGYDVGIDYSFELNEVFKNLPGRVELDTLISFTEEYDFLGTQIAGTSTAGISGATPDWKAASTLVYRLDNWLFQIRHTYTPEIQEDWQSALGYGGPNISKTPAVSTIDLSGRWDVRSNLTLTASVNNVLDETPPQLVIGFTDQANTDASIYAPWVLGRTFNIAARVTF
jgi:iron complex outermembrane recepter protein